MTETQAAPGTTAEQPLFFKWVRNADESVNWGRILLMLGLTMATAYLSVKTQKAAAAPDFERTIRMGLAQRKITLGVKVQRLGKQIEDTGWAAYDQVRQ